MSKDAAPAITNADHFVAKRADRGTRGTRRTVCLGAILLGCILVLCLLAGSAAKKVSSTPCEGSALMRTARRPLISRALQASHDIQREREAATDGTRP